MIIGINGRMQSGKDTVAALMMDMFANVQRVAFADKLKESAAALFGISLEELDWLKKQEDLHLVIADLEGQVEPWDSDYQPLNFRQILQRYGTEAHREVFGDDFWVTQALDKTATAADTVLVVTDCRFPNEAIAILDRGGVIVKVARKEADEKPVLHASEQDLSFWVDHVIDNNGDMADLRLNVVEFCDRLRSERGVEFAWKGVSC